jgi:3-oxoacyl-[acyl-carrier protein] reductase
MRLKNKTAVITGGARGIGRATAELFAKEGAQVFIWDVLPVGAETAAAINAAGGRAEFLNISVTDFSAIEAAAAELYARVGHIDILVNNAGVTRDRTLLKMSLEEWKTVLDINLNGVFNCTKAVAPYMVEGRYGRILCASSINGVHGAFGQTNYSATKAALIGMCRTWAKELGPKGITANAVAPGYIETDMTEALPEAMRAAGIQSIPVGRLGQPEDVAAAYLFLASEEASFINGQVLGVNGGQGI